jgi:uncharacterized membrane protein
VISGPAWILWIHLLAAALWLGGAAVTLGAILPGMAEGIAAAAKRAHFLTSRAMEVLVITGVLNVALRGMGSQMSFTRGFLAMLSIKMLLLLVMAGLQIWMGSGWKRPDIIAAARRARVGLTVQLLLGAMAVLLGMGLRAV